MIRIAYSDVSDLDLVKGYELVTDSRKEKIDSFRFDKDKKLSCGVELLLVRLLADIGINDPVFSIDISTCPTVEIILLVEYQTLKSDWILSITTLKLI